MNIEYKEHSQAKVSKYSLSDILEDKACDYNSGALEEADRKARVALQAMEKLTEILYDKGVINHADIVNLVSTFLYCDNDSIKVVK